MIDIIIKTFLKNKEEVLSANITFLEYKIITEVNGGIFKGVPLRDFKFDLNNATTLQSYFSVVKNSHDFGSFLSYEFGFDKFIREFIVGDILMPLYMKFVD